jgi:pimeloyl-ACP methyl ester carboxylesterase
VTEPKTHTLDAPGAVLHHDVRSNDSSAQPVLLLIGSPMGADGFVALAGYFADRTVVTYDPRGAGRSKRTDGALRSTTEEHADDLHRLILALDPGPVDVFGSSGGAVNGLALVARLGTAPITFPGGHDGFLQPDPDAFATTVRKVLAG